MISVCLVVRAAQANLRADSVDYYASLQRTPMLVPGMVGLLLSRNRALRILGIAPAALLPFG